jgi:hypothetical protein
MEAFESRQAEQGTGTRGGKHMAVRRKQENRFLAVFREPAVINAAQVVTNLAAAGAGLLAAIGAGPTFLTGQVGPFLAVVVGLVLVIGGTIGTITVLLGNWWLERVALLILGLGWVMILPSAFGLAMTGRSPGVWLVIALIFAALGDVFKRYQRIQWAYLDPAK